MGTKLLPRVPAIWSGVKRTRRERAGRKLQRNGLGPGGSCQHMLAVVDGADVGGCWRRTFFSKRFFHADRRDDGGVLTGVAQNVRSLLFLLLQDLSSMTPGTPVSGPILSLGFEILPYDRFIGNVSANEPQENYLLSMCLLMFTGQLIVI